MSLLAAFRAERDRLRLPSPPAGAEGPLETSWPDDPPAVPAEMALVRFQVGRYWHAQAWCFGKAPVLVCRADRAISPATVETRYGPPENITCPRCRAAILGAPSENRA